MYGGKTVGVVVPAYNEERFVGDVLDSLPDFVDRVYAVDDASTDATWDEIRDHATVERAPRTDAATGEADETPLRADGDGGTVVAIRHERNRGAGGAIKTGYLAARDDGVDVTVTIDADGQMDPAMMTQFLDPVVAGDADYAKGDRLATPEFREGMPRFRLAGNWLLTGLTWIASGYWDVTDPQNGYTAISLDALEAVDVEELYEYYGYCNDLLVKLNVAGMSVVDVPMPASYGDEQSSIDYGGYVPKVSLMLLRNFVWRLRTRYRSHPAGLAYALALLGAVAVLLRAVVAVALALAGSDSSEETSDADDSSGRRFPLSLVATVVGLVAGVVLDRRNQP
ncbi:glycosyltransferase family 2 protein [Halomicrococcus gelatinilyticus]|uniref:glycosyltransferase family 2 protein n=1 Tax=Halomicrococcus gelatinilyticus TaxID=1702103 RepID=UPI002E132972